MIEIEESQLAIRKSITDEVSNNRLERYLNKLPNAKSRTNVYVGYKNQFW